MWYATEHRARLVRSPVLLDHAVKRREMSTPVLATKLNIPPPRPNLVPRLRLIEPLNEGLYRKLTLISAPAGFGKTTLVSRTYPWRPMSLPTNGVAGTNLTAYCHQVRHVGKYSRMTRL